jgi:DNA-binding beta-propeller fold protein YncE
VTYIADTGNDCIRAVDASGNVSTLVAGGDQFAGPNGLALDAGNNLLFFADTKNHAVLAVSLFGPPKPSVVVRALQQPSRLAVHSSGHLAITTLSSHAVYLVLVGCKSPGLTCTCQYGGNSVFSLTSGPCVFVIGEEHSCGHVDGPASRVRFCNPSGLAFNGEGALFIADTQNDAIRVLVLPPDAEAQGNSPHPADMLASLTAARVATLAVGRKPKSGPGKQGDGKHDDDDDDDGASPDKSPHRRALSRLYLEGLPRGHAIDQSGLADATAAPVHSSVLARPKRGPASDGSDTSMILRKPVDLAVSPDGTRLFVADTERHRVVLFGSITEAIAGGAGPGYTDGSALQARFDLPSGIAAVTGLFVLVADPHRNVIRSLVQVESSAWTAGSAPQTHRAWFLPLLMVVSLSVLVLFFVGRVLRRKPSCQSALSTTSLTSTMRHLCMRIARAFPVRQRLTRHREAYAMAPPYQRVPRSYLETSF